MGQEQSAPDVDEKTPPRTLKDRTVGSVADFIKDGRAKKIVVMVGTHLPKHCKSYPAAFTY